jgi:hypothetical protein
MSAAAVQETESSAEVVCLFCGMHTPAPPPQPARRSARKAADATFRVSIIRCHACGKEAPYQFSTPSDGYEEQAKAARAGD